MYSEIYINYVIKYNIKFSGFDCHPHITILITTTGQEKPQLRELNRIIVPVWAAQWREIGEAIGMLPHELEIISENHAYHPRRSEECCKVMFKTWLDKDAQVSWNKIREAINSLSGTSITVEETIKKGM